VATFVEVCQNQHHLAAADEMFHPDFVKVLRAVGPAYAMTAAVRSRD
jgi:hypothetical protein